MNSAKETPSSVQNSFGNAYSSGDGLTVQAGVISGTVNINRTQRRVLFPKTVYDATFDAANKEHVPSCLPGTRVEVLREIQEWIDGRNPKRLYWLNGMAGTGKSTIALTLARAYNRAEKEVRLGGSFFFSRGGGDLASAGRFAATIAAQLTEVSPKLCSLVEHAIESNPRLESLSVRAQWEKLVLGPLSGLYRNTAEPPTPLLVIVDALDECNGSEDVKVLINCLGDMTQIEGARCRVFMTSRPDQPIKVGLSSNSSASRENFVLHDIERSIVDQDLGLYYRDQLANMKARLSLDDDLLSENMVGRLVERSHGLFIYAATVCRFVRDGNFLAVERLERLITSDRAATAEQELDKMYTTVLEHSFISETERLDPSEKEKVYQLFRRIVGSIVISFDVMSSENLARLLGEKPQRIRTALSTLHSVIDVPEKHQRPIRILHPSFRDFLLNPERCVVKSYLILACEAHQILAIRCFDILMSELQLNPLNLAKPGSRAGDVTLELVKKCISMPLRYSSRYWMEHILKSEATNIPAVPLLQFMQEKYLLWLECLAWMGQLEQGVEAISLLNIFLIEQSTNEKLFSTAASKNQISGEKTYLQLYIEDALRFLQSHSSSIERAPLQVYLSALIFSPQDSKIRIQNEDKLPKWILNLPPMPEKWKESSQVLSISLPARVYSLAISTDSRLVAIACEPSPKHFMHNSCVYVRSTMTGKEKFILKGNHESYASVAFSPDGDYVAAVAKMTVSIWNISAAFEDVKLMVPEFELRFENERHQSDSDEQPGEKVSSCAFSPDGRLLAASSFSSDIWVWNLQQRRSAKYHFETNRHLNRLLFSSDSSLLISVSRFHTNAAAQKLVSTWDMGTGHKLEKEVNIPACEPMAFLDGTKYIGLLCEKSNNRDRVVIRDARTGSVYRTLATGHFVPNIAVFKPRDREPLLGSFDSAKLIVWTSDKYKATQHFESSGSVFRNAAFSPDGNLAVTSGGMMVKIFTIDTFPVESSSPESIYQDYTIRAGRWMDRIKRPFKRGFTRPGRSLSQYVFDQSPDGSLLAVGHPGSLINVWETKTGKQRCRLGIIGNCRKLEFSPNNQFCSVKTDKGLRIFDIKNNQYDDFVSGELFRGTISSHFEFSPSSNRIIQIEEDFDPRSHEDCRVWEIQNKKMVLKLSLPKPYWDIKRFILSPDDELYGILGGHSVEIRRISNNQLLYKRGIANVGNFKFLPDSKSVLVMAQIYDQGVPRPGNTFFVWNLIRSKLTAIDSSYLEDAQTSVSDDGNILAIAGRSFVDVFDLIRPAFLHRMKPEPGSRGIRLRPPSRTTIVTERGTNLLPGSSPPASPYLYAAKDCIQENGEYIVAIPPTYRNWDIAVNGHSVVFYNKKHDPLFLILDEGVKSMASK